MKTKEVLVIEDENDALELLGLVREYTREHSRYYDSFGSLNIMESVACEMRDVIGKILKDLNGDEDD